MIRRLEKWAAITILLLAAIVGGYYGLKKPFQGTRLTFLSVGQGDCAVFQTAGHTILIDAGPNTNGYDAGKYIVVPKLRSLGVNRIDLVLLSHPDSDHTGGLGALLGAFPVDKIGISSAFSRHEGMLNQIRALGCSNKVSWLRPSQSVSAGEFNIEVACPPWNPEMKDNDGSEFVKIVGEGCSAVFTGDASEDAETTMEPGADWSAQIMKVGHHGSRTSTSDSWLDEVHPKWAVVSCGRNNSYGHPNGETLRRIEAHHVPVARTDTEGDITFVPSASGFRRVQGD